MSSWDATVFNGWGHEQPCACSKCSPRRPTETLKFNVEFDVRDMLQDSKMKKVLQEREQRFLSNMEWLDKDLDRRIKEEEEKERLHQENISWLDADLQRMMKLKEEENRISAATIIQKYAKRMMTSTYRFQSARPPPNTQKSIVQSHDNEGTEVDEVHFTLKKTKNSLYGKGRSYWVINEDKILDYLNKSIQDGKWETKSFLKHLYTDKKYRDWSEILAKKGIKFRKNYTTGEYVIGMGDKFKNWKKDGEWICDSFHFIKQIYDTMKKRQQKEKKISQVLIWT